MRFDCWCLGSVLCLKSDGLRCISKEAGTLLPPRLKQRSNKMASRIPPEQLLTSVAPDRIRLSARLDIIHGVVEITEGLGNSFPT